MSPEPGPTNSGHSTDSYPPGVWSAWKLAGVPLEIRIEREVIAGITQDILAFPESEVSGALRGRRGDSDPEIVWIERYQKLESAAETPHDAVGFYRGTAARNGFPDSDGPANSFLLTIQPDAAGALTAQVFLPGASGEPEPANPTFPFGSPPHSKPGRLIPDFDKTGELQRRGGSVDEFGDETSGSALSTLKKAWPFLAALALMGGAVWLLPQMLSKQTAAPGAVTTAGAQQPLGLYVDPASPNPSSPKWRVSWNHDASILHGARLVRLFIHDGEEQNGIDLSAAELESGMYEYLPHGNDVTFRIEATAADGKAGAESFRLVKQAGAVSGLSGSPKPASSLRGTSPPKAVHRVTPVVAAGVRSLIRVKFPIDIRVRVDKHGRVTSAVLISRPHNSVETSLAGSALRAARAWRFEPALRNGEAVSGTQTLHFVFER